MATTNAASATLATDTELIRNGSSVDILSVSITPGSRQKKLTIQPTIPVRIDKSASLLSANLILNAELRRGSTVLLTWKVVVYGAVSLSRVDLSSLPQTFRIADAPSTESSVTYTLKLNFTGSITGSGTFQLYAAKGLTLYVEEQLDIT